MREDAGHDLDGHEAEDQPERDPEAPPVRVGRDGCAWPCASTPQSKAGTLDLPGRAAAVMRAMDAAPSFSRPRRSSSRRERSRCGRRDRGRARHRRPRARLVVVELATGRVLRHVATLPKPRSIETVGHVAVVAHSEIGAVSLVHGADAPGRARPARLRRASLHGRAPGRATRVRQRCEAGRGGDARRPARTRARADARRRARPAHHDRPVRPDALGLARLEGARGRRSSTSRGADPRLIRRFAPPFLAHDVGWAPDGRHVWVSSGDRNELAVYEARTGKVLLTDSGRRAAAARDVSRRPRLRGERRERNAARARGRRPRAPVTTRARGLVQRAAGPRLGRHARARPRDALHPRHAWTSAPRGRRSRAPRTTPASSRRGG